jgi:hypothetical protein
MMLSQQRLRAVIRAIIGSSDEAIENRKAQR